MRDHNANAKVAEAENCRSSLSFTSNMLWLLNTRLKGPDTPHGLKAATAIGWQPPCFISVMDSKDMSFQIPDVPVAIKRVG
jgi:hypothetical protein